MRMALLIVRKKHFYSRSQTTRRFYFECDGNCLPFGRFANTSPAVSVLALRGKITALKSALPKAKNLKPTVINTYKKMGEGWPISLCRGHRLSENVSRADEAASDVI